MNDFVNIVEANGFGHLLSIHNYNNFKPKGNDELSHCLLDIVKNNLKVMIDPDTDPDGFLSALTVKETLDIMGHDNYTINQPMNKRHGITIQEINKAINEGYDYVIIVDSSTNLISYIRRLVTAGVKVIVIDHHQTAYVPEDYPEGALVVNSTMKHQDEYYNKLSACALTAILMNNVLTENGYDFQMRFMLYAYITLYSDSCDLSSSLNISIIHMAERFKGVIPEWIIMFMSKWDSLNRGFIEYKLVPRINALVRMNHLDVIHVLLYIRLEDYQMPHLQSVIEDNYKEAKEITSSLADLAIVEEHPKFVVARLDNLASKVGITKSTMRNFTGVVASRIMQRYNKTTMTLIDMGTGLEGSVRDPFNRNIYKVFKQFLKAGGHKSAFGVYASKAEYSSIIDNINLYDDMLDLDESKTIIIDADRTEDLDIQIRIMGEYNELSGGSIPVGYLRKVVDSDCVVTKYEKYVRIKWHDYEITAFAENVFYQDILIIKPTVGTKGYQLLVNNVL